ncbi:hypothetical protein [Streptomyces antarcticus]|uniref:hypothetical protein n=1 Tax=Streptomyces antarcticus TaxID=2996458 RepID=UPI002271AA34|nr:MULTISPECIES: hypothetical protein [unclassified Streptomyces]MCY0944655.1 hypothetical protein [Streptomyces sp. H34-AA3]MCZ4087812.1 hypothetical protein [Streptomyces sp. H34-S5]
MSPDATPGLPMIAPQLTADGRAVRWPIADRLAPLVDDLALAYAEDPDGIGRLLADHAAHVMRLDFAQCSEDMPEYERCIRAAQADGTRDALLDELPSAPQVDALLAPDDAITYATRLTKLAASTRHAKNRTPRA